MGDGYDNFCAVTGRNPETLRSCLEFSLYTGFGGINVWKLGYPETEHVLERIQPEVLHKVRAFAGPHGHTMIKAYLAKRNSLRGRLNAAWRKPMYVIGFAMLLVACLVRSSWRG